MNLTVSDILNKTLLVGITYYTHDEQYIEQKQFWGKVVEVTNEQIILLQNNGETFSLPPDLSSTKPAPLGEYKLRSTGEVVVNPDYIATWLLHRPKENANTD